MKEIIIMCGIPCSGKSTQAKLAEMLLCYRTLSRDEIRLEVFGKNYKQNDKDEVLISKLFDYKFDAFIKNGYNIILDNCHTKEKYLNEIIKKVPKDYTFEVVFFDIPLWKAYYRNVKRWIFTGKFIPFSVIKNMKKNYDKIDKSKYGKIN